MTYYERFAPTAADQRLVELLSEKEISKVVGVCYGFPYVLKLLKGAGKDVYLAGIYPVQLLEAGYKRYDYSFKPDAVIIDELALNNSETVECIERLKDHGVEAAYVLSVEGRVTGGEGINPVLTCEDGSAIYTVDLLPPRIKEAELND